MVKRTIQLQSGSYITIIPSAIIDAMGLKKGDKVSFGIEGKNVILTPVRPSAKMNAQASHTQPIKGEYSQ